MTERNDSGMKIAQLMRDLDDARRLHVIAINERVRLQRERDEARAEASRLTAILERVEGPELALAASAAEWERLCMEVREDAIRYRRERDEARAKLAALREAGARYREALRRVDFYAGVYAECGSGPESKPIITELMEASEAFDAALNDEAKRGSR